MVIVIVRAIEAAYHVIKTMPGIEQTMLEAVVLTLTSKNTGITGLERPECPHHLCLLTA